MSRAIFVCLPACLLLCSNASLRQLNNSSQCLTYSHQLSVDTIHCFTHYADADQHQFLQGLAFYCVCLSVVLLISVLFLCVFQSFFFLFLSLCQCQSVGRSDGRTVGRSVGRSVGRFIDLSFISLCFPIFPLFFFFFSLSVGGSVGGSDCRWVGRSVDGRSFVQSLFLLILPPYLVSMWSLCLPTSIYLPACKYMFCQAS